MKVFITGGLGFIGAHLAKRLADEGHEIVVFDSMTHYIDPKISRHPKYLDWRLKNLLKSPNIEIIRGDVRHKMHVLRSLLKTTPEVIVHLAAIPIAVTSDSLSEEAADIKLNGTLNLLETLHEVKSIKRFIYASSSMVYGDFKKIPCPIDHPKNPKGVYGAVKLCGEILTKSVCNLNSVEWVVVRPSAVYGPTDSNRRVTQIFIENALEGKPLVLHNGGQSMLDFTYIDDIVEGFYLCVTKQEAGNHIFNITAGEGRTLKEMAEIIKRELPDAEIIYKEARPDEKRPERGTLDISDAQRILAFKPRYNLETGMKKYIAFVKDFDKKFCENI